LIVPIHEINALEAARVNNGERRVRLATFMVALSENHCFRPTHTIANDEKRAAVASVYLGREARAVRPRIVGYGLDALFGGEDSEVIRRVKSIGALVGFPGVMDALRAAPEQTVEFIVHSCATSARTDPRTTVKLTPS
jgi:hypothetical protein